MGNISENFLPVSVGSPADQLAIRDSLQNGEGSVVPVVFGKVKIDGNQLWIGDINILTTDTSPERVRLSYYGSDADKAYEAGIWFALGMGKLHLVEIRSNDKSLDINNASIIQQSVDYNDGTGIQKADISSDIRFILSSNYGKHGFTTDAVSVIMSTDMTAGTDFICNAGNGSIFVCSILSGTTTIFKFSYNGFTFETGETKTLFYARACVYANGLFVSVGNTTALDATGNGEMYTSVDGKTWTIQDLATVDPCSPLHAVCAGPTDVFVAVGYEETILLGLVVSGVLTWYSYRSGLLGTLYGVAYGAGLFVAVGATVAGTALILTSTDGQTWTERSYGLACSLKAIVFNGTYFLAVGTNDKWAKTTNGASWIDGTTGLSGSWNSIAYGDGKFVIGGNSGKLATATVETAWTDFTGTAFQVVPGVAFYADVLNVYYNEFAVSSWATKLKGIAHIYFPWAAPITGNDRAIVCNSEGKSPSMKFVVQNLLDDTGGAESELSSDSLNINDSNGNNIGNNPAAVIYKILRNSQWGLGIAFAKIDQTSFNQIAAKFDSSRPYGINFASTDILSAKELIDKIKELTDVFIDEEDDVLYLNTLYDASATSVLTIGDNDVEGVSISRQTWKEVDNVYEGEFTDKDCYFEKKTIIIKNEAAIFNAGGYERKKKIDLTMFISSAVASQRLYEIMQRESFPKISATFKMGRAAYALRPGDLVTWTNTEYGISGTFRVTEIGMGGISDMQIQVSIIQAFENLWDGNYKIVIAAQGNIPQRTI